MQRYSTGSGPHCQKSRRTRGLSKALSFDIQAAYRGFSASPAKASTRRNNERSGPLSRDFHGNVSNRQGNCCCSGLNNHVVSTNPWRSRSATYRIVANLRQTYGISKKLNGMEHSKRVKQPYKLQ